jgi:hypothetical protein
MGSAYLPHLYLGRIVLRTWKLQKQRDFQGTQKPKQTMTIAGLNLIPNTKRKNQNKIMKYAKE